MCQFIRGDRTLQEKDQRTVRVTAGQTLFFRDPASPFPEGKLGAVKGQD